MIVWEFVEEILETNTSVTVDVKGVSMYPKYYTNDLLTVVPLPKKPNQVFVGDVVLVKTKNRFLIHRVVEAKGEEIKTKGDNCLLEDEKIERVIGLITKRQLTLKSVIKRLNYWRNQLFK